MAHDHHHRFVNYDRAFAFGVALNIGFVIVEAAYGIMAGSLALLADAGHNLSDVLGLLLAWGANYLVRRKPTGRRTYGWRKSSILAALINAVILLVALGGKYFYSWGDSPGAGSLRQAGRKSWTTVCLPCPPGTWGGPTWWLVIFRKA